MLSILPTIIKKHWIRLLLLLIFIIFLSAPIKAFAQQNYIPKSVSEFAQEYNNSSLPLGPWVSHSMDSVINSLTCLGGVFPCFTEPGSGTTYKPTRKNTAFGAGLTYISYIYQYQPISSSEYFADLGSNLNIIKPAHAAGSGFNILSPVLSLWKTFRNLSYIFYIAIFLIIGLMILFRSKIDPQTIIGIQHALPKIVVSLLLVTFSYTIVGLMIDIAIFSSNVAYHIFTPAYRSSCGADISDDCLTTLRYNPGDKSVNIFSLMMSLNKTGGPGGISETIQSLLDNLNIDIPGLGPLGGLIFTIVIIGAVFRTFFALISAYVGIVISVILAPFQLMFSALPGSKANIGSFLKDVLANTLVFPATFIMLLFGAIIIGDQGAGDQPWNITQPTKDFQWFPLPLGDLAVGTRLINNLIALGILLLLPSIPQVIKDSLEVKEKVPVSGAMESLRGATRNIPIIGQFLGG